MSFPINFVDPFWGGVRAAAEHGFSRGVRIERVSLASAPTVEPVRQIDLDHKLASRDQFAGHRCRVTAGALDADRGDDRPAGEEQGRPPVPRSGRRHLHVVEPAAVRVNYRHVVGIRMGVNAALRNQPW